MKHVGVENSCHKYLVRLFVHDKGKRLLDIGKGVIYNGYGASFGGVMMMGMTMGMMMGILFSRGVEVHVDKCLRFYCGVPKFRGARRSVYRHAVKGILMTISSILAASN